MSVTNSPKLYTTLNSMVFPSHSHNVQGSFMSELPSPKKDIPKEGLQRDPVHHHLVNGWRMRGRRKNLFLYWLGPEVAIIPLAHVSLLRTSPRPPLHAWKAVKWTHQPDSAYQPQVCTMERGTQVSGVHLAISTTPVVKVLPSLPIWLSPLKLSHNPCGINPSFLHTPVTLAVPLSTALKIRLR